MIKIISDSTCDLSPELLEKYNISLPEGNDDTVLVAIMLVNNEIGAKFPVEQAVPAIRRVAPKAHIHCDAVQAAGKLPLYAERWGLDSVAVSAHKIHGPKGAGALYIAPKLKAFPPLLFGGGQESNFRSGTEGTPAIFGFAAACEACKATMQQDVAKETELLNELVEKLCKLDGPKINGSHQAPHILSLSVPGLPTQNSINLLQDAGICVSAGSACAKGHRSHVMTAMKLTPEVIDGSFRVSICRDTTSEELDKLVDVIKNELLPRARA